MAFKGNRQVDTLVASIDLNDAQFRFVELNATEHKIIIAPARKAYGVLENNPKAGEHGSVVVDGIAKVQAGGAVAVGDYITSAASGWGAVVSSGTANDKLVMGRALTAAASGSVFSMRFDKFVIVSTGGLPV